MNAGEFVKQSQVTLKEYSGCLMKEKGKHKEISQSSTGPEKPKRQKGERIGKSEL